MNSEAWVSFYMYGNINYDLSFITTFGGTPGLGISYDCVHQKVPQLRYGLDTLDPIIDGSKFGINDWTSSEFGNVQGRELPVYMTEPCGIIFTMR